jgi:hypothetical protein
MYWQKKGKSQGKNPKPHRPEEAGLKEVVLKGG